MNENKIDQSQDQMPKKLIPFCFWLLKKILEKKKWWLLPVWILIVMIAIILVLSGHGSILPIIYLAF